MLSLKGISHKVGRAATYRKIEQSDATLLDLAHIKGPKYCLKDD